MAAQRTSRSARLAGVRTLLSKRRSGPRTQVCLAQPEDLSESRAVSSAGPPHVSDRRNPRHPARNIQPATSSPRHPPAASSRINSSAPPYRLAPAGLITSPLHPLCTESIYRRFSPPPSRKSPLSAGEKGLVPFIILLSLPEYRHARCAAACGNARAHTPRDNRHNAAD